MIEIVVNDKKTTERLGRISAQVSNPSALLKVLGRRGGNELRSWFTKRNAEPNKMNAPKRNFWSMVAGSVNAGRIEVGRVRISVANPYFAQKVFGGPIIPKNAKNLTIPVDPLSRGRTVSVFEYETGIKLFLLKKKGGGLTKLLAGLSASKSLKVFYVLSKGVDQDPDPYALPPRAQFRAAIVEQAQQELARQIKEA